MRYVLVTAARNEASLIEGTVCSVISQTIRPVQWVIVSDGSTDQTDEIVQRYASAYDFIELLRIERPAGRDFASKAYAVRAGFERVAGTPCEYIGNLDADVTLYPEYFEHLLARFGADSRLGIGGGWILEADHGVFRERPHNSTRWVPHAVQLLRRACYEEIGDYLPLPYGGEDTCAVVRARMKGWKAVSFADLPVRHHRHTASAGGVLRNRFRVGLLDHSLGYHPVYEILKCARRALEYPCLVGAAVAFAGFLSGYLGRTPRLVSDEFVHWLRREQVGRFSRVIRRRAVGLVE